MVRQRCFFGGLERAFDCAEATRQKDDNTTKNKIDFFNAVNLEMFFQKQPFGKKFKLLNYD
jgi:hypothetical protein